MAILLAFPLLLSALSAQTLKVKQRSGNQTAYILSNIQKMTFQDGNVNIQEKDNTTVVHALDGLRHLNFFESTTTIDRVLKQENNANMVIYPNPFTDILNVDLRGSNDTEGSITIFCLNGRVLLTQKNNGSGPVALNLSHLPNGVFFCRYTSSTVNKSIKIIKK
ncbi:hypothetical protein JCM15548_12603 [Geofilum rubicundum JCM 15548]|uniref:Secretion system C-terminal sorting domain-containing protein n=1 Tax=Geofilum rubicundum JCM 15548 TaxID=1236989 RepID=A0A0E9LZN8_9BACT|nr:hypothetical protein JCM15548_12603 [Geofilum rubicundum JCM 15548]